MISLTARRTHAATVFVALLFAAALSGCGTSVEPALVKSAGEHGDALEQNYAQLSAKVLKNTSTRDLKDINAAIKAGDLKKATPGDLRRAEDEVQRRIDAVAEARRKVLSANLELRRTPLPDFEKYLDDSSEVRDFSDDYGTTTTTIRSAGSTTLLGMSVALTSLERYLDFLEQWEQFVDDGDTDGLEATARESDKAAARLDRIKLKIDNLDVLDRRLERLIGRMAAAASEDSQLNKLIEELKKQYPKSYLAKHIKLAD